jgi:sugar phosphate isomerase/epimerase
MRLGIDQPADWWPSTPRLKSYEAAGFDYLQVRTPPRELLADRGAVRTHARALRDMLGFTGLELILHAPDDLLAGTPEHDRELAGALEYAGLCRAGLLVYHGARVPVAAHDVEARLAAEERSLRQLLRLAGSNGVRVAIENLAPLYAGFPELASHRVNAVHELVQRLGGRQVGMCLDLGHAHIVAGLTGRDLLEVVEPVLDHVILFHVHDNFGAGERPRAGAIEPLRLDLHLAPGAGSVPWAQLAPLVSAHRAPLQLEVHPAARPEPATLAVLTREVLGGMVTA